MSKRKKDQDSIQDGYLRQQKYGRTLIDYQPDICKDYKETGFCGFGDSCKFLHDRSDYKSGCQEIEEEEPEDKYVIKDSDEEDNDDKDACAICGNEYKDPIITKCKHFFCIDCAEKECNTECFTCQKPTSGIFKNAKKLLAKK